MMEKIKLFDAEMKFMNIIWDHAPINSTELVKLANEELGWKKSTTYTVLRKLGKRRILLNVDATVTYLVKREEVQQSETEEFIDKIYDGSLKLFLTSFLNKEKLTESQASELKKIIDENTTREE